VRGSCRRAWQSFIKGVDQGVRYRVVGKKYVGQIESAISFEDASELLCIWMHQALCEGCRHEFLLVSRAMKPVGVEFDSL